MQLKKLILQFLKFGIVGASNTLISLLIYYGLLYLGVYYIAAYTIGFAVSVLNAYFWSSRFVFKKNRGYYNKKTIAKTYLSYGFTFMLSNGMLFVFVDVLDLSSLIAPVLILCVTVPLNFLLNKFWVFK
ncbi:MAG TPA: GtrA family protein [Ruminococcaceae bacterium]|jgi:putative flippase GtrA|nr:GtrA family protein [Oscillospiraceae bacterium]